jgi:protein involved in sex pheromone biosynthesis
MKKIVTFVMLAVLLGLSGCADKEDGKEQFEEAKKLIKGEDTTKAKKLLQKSCSNEYAKGCAILTFHYIAKKTIRIQPLSI